MSSGTKIDLKFKNTPFLRVPSKFTFFQIALIQPQKGVRTLNNFVANSNTTVFNNPPYNLPRFYLIWDWNEKYRCPLEKPSYHRRRFHHLIDAMKSKPIERNFMKLCLYNSYMIIYKYLKFCGHSISSS